MAGGDTTGGFAEEAEEARGVGMAGERVREERAGGGRGARARVRSADADAGAGAERAERSGRGYRGRAPSRPLPRGAAVVAVAVGVGGGGGDFVGLSPLVARHMPTPPRSSAAASSHGHGRDSRVVAATPSTPALAPLPSLTGLAPVASAMLAVLARARGMLRVLGGVAGSGLTLSRSSRA